jgi:predicted DNA-binding protein
MITPVELDPKTEARLKALAAETGRPEAFYVREALAEYLEARDDAVLAEKLLSQPEREWSMGEVERDLGLDR